VCTTRFYLHQVRSKSKDWKDKYFKSLWEQDEFEEFKEQSEFVKQRMSDKAMAKRKKTRDMYVFIKKNLKIPKR
jgi:hypothetical protein